MQIALILSFAVGIFLSLVTVGCHVENTMELPLGIQSELRAEIQVAKW